MISERRRGGSGGLLALPGDRRTAPRIAEGTVVAPKQPPPSGAPLAPGQGAFDRTRVNGDTEAALHRFRHALTPASRLPGPPGLGEVEDLTVVTNAINIAMELANRPNIKLLVTGGSLRERSFALVGPFGEAMLGQIHINRFFLGVTGISMEHGVTTLDLLEASMYKAIAKAAGEVIVVSDHSKFGSVTLAPIAGIGEVTRIVTDTGIPAEYVQELRECGVEVIVAEPTGKGG